MTTNTANFIKFWLAFIAACGAFLFGCAFIGSGIAATNGSTDARLVLGFLLIITAVFFAWLAWKHESKIEHPSQFPSVEKWREQDEALRRVSAPSEKGKFPRPFRYSDSDTARVLHPLDPEEDAAIDSLMNQLGFPEPNTLP